MAKKIIKGATSKKAIKDDTNAKEIKSKEKKVMEEKKKGTSGGILKGVRKGGL